MRALDRFVADVYGARRAVADGVVPNGLVSTCEGYVRAMVGVEPPLGRFVHVAGIDLVRDDDGVWRVLEDNLRCPSGLSYVVQNRAFMRRAFPEAFGDHHVEPVGHAPFLLLSALMAAAPEGRESPRVVVLTPGPANAAYYEHAFLAQQMGVAAGGGARPGGARPARLPAHDRRAASAWTSSTAASTTASSTPASLRSDSLLGVSGLMQACATAASPSATRWAPASPTTRPSTPTCPTSSGTSSRRSRSSSRCPPTCSGARRTARYVLANLDSLVVKAVDGAGGYGMLIGPHATPGERQAFAKRVTDNPRGYIAQETIRLSRAPVLVGERFRARHVDLRPFVVYGERPVVVPGGLTRVALRDGSLVVNSSQGGGSKDTWVLSNYAGPGRRDALLDGARPRARREPRAPARGEPVGGARGRRVERRGRAPGVGAARARSPATWRAFCSPTAAPTSGACRGS